MTSPRILLVDDQRQVNRMLRASLELSGQDYRVTEVTSGEEALLELERGPVDLLVTDVRLPGISGLDLLARVRQLNPKARAILITGAPTDEIRAEAEALGIVAFLRKPLGTSFFLEAVASALRVAELPEPASMPPDETPRLAERLAVLRSELGAEAVLLIGDSGQVVVRAGDLLNLDLDATLPPLLSAFSAAKKVSGLLGSDHPSNFQYFDGDRYDFFVTNVGSEYGLLLAFRGKQGAGHMGAVVHFGRRAASDMLQALSQLGVVQSEPTSAPAPAPPPASVEEPASETLEPQLAAADHPRERQDIERFWDQAVADSGTMNQADGDALTYEQARKLGLLPEEPET